MGTRLLYWCLLRFGVTIVCSRCDWRKQVPFKWQVREMADHLVADCPGTRKVCR